MGTVIRDVQHAVRRLRNSPGFTIAATLTLAIAIGATSSVFGLVDGVLLKALPYRDPEQVLVIWESNPGRQLPQFSVSAANYLDWRAQSTAFTELAASSATLAAASGEPEFTVAGAQELERVKGLSVTPSYFETLGITPAVGRMLAADSGATAEVMISYGYWQRRFGGARSTVGQILALDGKPYSIVGVMPAGMPGDVQLWTRLSFTAADEVNRTGHRFVVYGRLKPGMSRELAARELGTIAQRLAAAYPKSNAGWSVMINPLVGEVVGDVRSPLLMLLCSAACVLLIGAANLANLFLVRYVAREREMAVRLALGATQSRIVRELLADAVVLAVGAGALGIGVAVGGVRALRMLAPPTLPRLSEIRVDARVVAFCALTSIATVLVFGLLPAWRASRGDVAGFFKEGGRGTGSARHHRLQDTLVVLQVAVALVLLTGAGLFVESFQHFRRMDPGFRPEGVLTAQIALPTERYPTAEQRADFVMSVVDGLAAQPGIDGASASSLLPDDDPPITSFAIVGDPTPDLSQVPVTALGFVSPSYFQTLGLRIREGRGVLPTDDRRAVKVVVVDEVLARRFFGRRDPLGLHLILGRRDTMEVVGVVGSVKQGGLVAPDVAELYIPLAQVAFPFLQVEIAVRTSGDPAGKTRELRQVVASLDKTLPVYGVKTMSERVAESIGTTRFSTFLASLFAAIAVALGMVGIYSVLAYIVSQRRREIAIRIALGASHANVMGDVLRRALALTGVGVILGSGAAWGLTQVLAGLFLGVSSHDPGIFAGAAAAFAVVALAAASVPAFRTTRISPAEVLTSV